HRGLGKSMDAVTGQDQERLLAELAEARARLDALVHDLRGIDRELGALAPDRRKHPLLPDGGGALGEPRGTAGAPPSWGKQGTAGAGEEQLRRVRSLVEGFEKRVAEIEERREAVLDEVQRQQQHTELLDFEVFEALEEQRRHDEEWVLDREMSAPPVLELVMPWTRGGEEDQRYRKSLATSLMISLVFALVIPQITLPLHSQDEETKVPERVVRLMMEARPLPPRVREETRPQPQERLVQQKPAEQAVPTKVRDAGPGKGSGEGPATGPGKGLLAFRDQLASVTEVQSIARLGAQARIARTGDAPRPPRSLPPPPA